MNKELINSSYRNLQLYLESETGQLINATHIVIFDSLLYLRSNILETYSRHDEYYVIVDSTIEKELDSIKSFFILMDINVDIFTTDSKCYIPRRNLYIGRTFTDFADYSILLTDHTDTINDVINIYYHAVTVCDNTAIIIINGNTITIDNNIQTPKTIKQSQDIDSQLRYKWSTLTSQGKDSLCRLTLMNRLQQLNFNNN